MKPKLVVIGNGMAGMRTVEELIQLAPEKYDITVFGAEPYGNYNRIMLTPVLFGAKSFDDIVIHDFDWYRRHNITLHCGRGKAVVDVDRDKRRVLTLDGTCAAYDILLIATGAKPSMLDVPGSDAEGVMGFRDIADVETMIAKSKVKQHAVVLGGGLLGLEAANGLSQRGVQVTVINRAGHLLNKQLDEIAAGFLQRELEAKGIAFRVGMTIAEILPKGGHVQQVRLSDNTLLPADFLIMATGIKPNKALAEDIGLACGQGILVDDSLLTSDANIYAVGECIEHRGELFGLVAPVYEQAKICARHLAGDVSYLYRSSISATMLKVTGIDLFSAGDFIGDADCNALTWVDYGLGLYRKIVLKGNTVVGMIMYGDIQGSAKYLEMIKQKTDIGYARSNLIFQPLELAA